MANKLKPCPFCGGEARLAHDFIHGWEVMCDNWKECIAHPSVVIYGDDSRDKAIEAWNNRPSPWHTGTPTDEGFWLVKYECVVDGKYKGRLTYRAVKIEKDKIDGFAYESGGIGAEEYWKPIEYQKIDDLWRGEE